MSRPLQSLPGPHTPEPDTIAALASGWAPAPRAIIRLSGPGVPALAFDLFESPPASTGSIAASRLRLTPTLALPCLTMRFDAPRSYTGEHTIEIVLPGNPILLERVLARLASHTGVREATPGEFSARAYLNGRLSLAQAEGVAAVIAAQTDAHLAAAADLASGRRADLYSSWMNEAATLLALVESGIDFTDQEDVVPIAPDELSSRISSLHAALLDHLGAAAGQEQTIATPRVVLAGPPNAGKSTLFNALLGRHRVVVSPIAGTTRDAIAEPLDLSRSIPAGPTVMLVDLAGLEPHTTHAPVDGAAQARALDEIRSADIILHCDPAGRFADHLPGSPGRPVIRLRTKADLPHSAPSTPQAAPALSICALDGWHMDILQRAIADAAWAASGSSNHTFLLPRHRRTLADAAAALAESRRSVDPTAHALTRPELTAASLRAAVDALGELAGRMSPDDVIGRIFATFCVGK